MYPNIFLSLGFAISLFFLVWAGLKDYKTRIISNRLLGLYGLCALIILSFNIGYTSNIILLLPVLAGVGASYLLFKLGIFRGADSKSLMALCVALPYYSFLAIGIGCLSIGLLGLVPLKLKIKRNIPFIPFLLIGVLTVLVIFFIS